jgi:phage terminase small subunit
MADKLTDKQKRFCDEYLIDLNATQAAIRAGYSEKTANRIANENLSKLDIQEYIQKRMKDREKRTEITQDKVLQEIARIAFDDIKNYLRFYTDAEGNVRTEVKDSDTIDTRNISEVSCGKDGQFKFKVYCKDNALNMLGKHLGMFTDKVESVNTNIDIDLSNLPPEALEEIAKAQGQEEVMRIVGKYRK